MILLRAVDRAIGVISLSVLARLLLPSDFGLVSLAVSVLAIIEAFGALNVEAALIRDQTAGRAQFDSAWTIQVATSCCLGAILALSAGLAADFFADSRVQAVLYVLASSTALGGFQNIGTVEFQKKLEFKRDFFFRFTTRLASTAVALVAAYLMRDYWALVIGMTSSAAFRVAMSYIVQPYRPRFSTEHLRPLLAFSKWLLAQNLISGVNSRLSNIILGRLTAFDLVAFFTVGSEIARLGTTEIQAPIRRAIYPGFVQVAENLENLRQTFLDSFGIMTILGLPVAVGVGVTADYIVHLLLGPRWSPAIPIIQIIALAGAIQTLRTGSHLIYIVLNRPYLTLILGAVSFGISLPLLILGIKIFGIIGAAWASVASAAITLVADYAVLAHHLRVRPSDFNSVLWRPVIAAGMMAAAVLVVRGVLPPATDWTTALLGLAIGAPLGAGTYIGTVLLLWYASKCPQGAERNILTSLALR